MPVNGFSIGKDIAVDILTPLGLVTFRNWTSFDKRAMRVKLQSKGMDGVARKLNLPDGWEGTMKYDRMDPTLDNYFAQEELNYYNGAAIQAITIIETITESDGSISAYQYSGVAWELSNAGNASGDSKVEQEITWQSSFRTQLT